MLGHYAVGILVFIIFAGISLFVKWYLYKDPPMNKYHIIEDLVILAQVIVTFEHVLLAALVVKFFVEKGFL